MVQLSYLYMTTVKTIALTIWAFVAAGGFISYREVKNLCLEKGLLFSVKTVK